MSQSSPKIAGAVAGTILVGGVLALVTWLWGAQIFKFFFNDGRTFSFFFLLLVLIIAAIVVAVVMSDDGSSGYGRQRYESSPVAVGVSSVLAVGLIITFVALLSTLHYNTQRQYVASIEIVNEVAPSFEERAPFRVAVQSSRQNLQDITGEITRTRAVTDLGETGEWNTLVNRRGPFLGYEAIQSVDVPLFGAVNPSRDVSICAFNEDAQLRFGGELPHNDLFRAFMWATPLDVTLDPNNVYSYCDGDIPIVVAPLHQVVGWYASYMVPYGVGLYNGETGEIAIVTDDDEIAKIPGSTYPMNIAIAQRESTHALGSWWDMVINVAGFEDTSADAGDPNGENRSEFQIRFSPASSGEVGIVSPLTPRGDSTSIVALGVVNASTFETGEHAPYVIYEYSRGNIREANSTVERTLRSDYASLGDWAAGAQVFEILPGADGAWYASIGQNQTVSYRATIRANGEVTLFDRFGQVIQKTNVDLGDEDGKPVPPPTAPPAIPSDLSNLTAEELRQLGEAILEELSRRSVEQ
jgi:hypothetical protein